MKAVEPRTNSALASQVWLKRSESERPKGSFSPERLLVATPVGTGKERGSRTVSETRPAMKNQSCVPKIGMSPFRTFWL